MKIKLFESGGEALPFVDYMPFEGIGGSSTSTSSTSTTSSSKDSSSKKDSDDIGIKDILSLVKELDGLPSDINRITQSLQSLYKHTSLYSDGEISTNKLVNTYLSTLLKIKIAKHNKAEYEFAKKEVTENDGLHEAAIDEYGNLFCQNVETGQMTKMTVLDYFKHSDEWQPLTNSNLLSFRKNNKNLAFNNDFLDIVSNGIGEEKVTKMIQQAISGLGTSDLQAEGYSKKQAENIIGGLELLQEVHNSGILQNPKEAMPIDGLYKMGLTSKDSQDQITSAINYLMKAMPKNAKTWLQLKSGNVEDPEKGARSLIASLMFVKSSPSSKFSIDIKEDPNKKDGDKKSSDMIKLDPSKAFVLGMGYQKEFEINTGNSYSVTVNGRFGILTDHSGKPLGEYSSLQEVSEGQYAGILDMHNATFGGSKIESLNKAFLLNSDIVGIDLPIDIEYKNKTGITRPDLNLASKIEQLHTAIKQGVVNGNDVNAVNNFCSQINLPPMYSQLDENGMPKLNERYYARFGRISAIVNDSALSENTPIDNTVSEVNGNKRDNFKKYMESKDDNYKLSNGFFGIGGDVLLEGAIYIPIREDLISASLGGGDYYKLDDNNAISVAQKWADAQRLLTYQKAPSLNELMK